MNGRPALLRNLRRLSPLLFACLLLGGCVYLRLLELRDQLADFDRFFSIRSAPGLTLICQQPVLLVEDMGFFGLAPEWQTRLGVALRWHLRWIKDYAAPGEQPEDYEVTADFMFVDGKLKSVHLPERVFTFVPKSLVLAALRSLGHASVDKSRQSARAAIAMAKNSPLTRSDLLRFLGTPLEARHTGDILRLHYRYTMVADVPSPGKIDLTFTLDATTESVAHVEVRMPHAVIELDWPKPAAAGTAPAP
ncbi:MAG TPA: hypothetical protein VMI53_14210 [Opitutaceae bacterium]|nr:hypothetical protein [Opitutaceae bacterium]